MEGKPGVTRVRGEESGLIASIEDGRGMPKIRPPFPAGSGVFGQGSNVNNVQTTGGELSLLAQATGQGAFPLRYQGEHTFLGPTVTGIRMVFNMDGETGLIRISVASSLPS